MPSQPNTWIVPTTAILLGIYGLIIVWAMFSPSNDPQRGMAQGFLMMALIILLALGGLLWVGSHPYRRFIVWPLFLVSAYPAVMGIAFQVYKLIHSARNN